MNKLTPEINIEIVEHGKLNHSKGGIYNTDLTYLSDEEILSELKNQYVIAIKRITKKQNTEEKQTGLFILTFATATIPDEINIGYEKVEVRHYIPPPLRCWNCFHFGHPTQICKKDKKCLNCDNNYHFETNKQIDQKCEKQTKCTNCLSTSHNAISKQCPIFIKQKEIIKIKITEQTDLKTAKTIYAKRHINTIIQTTYASILKNDKINEPTNKTTQSINNKNDNSENNTISANTRTKNSNQTNTFITPTTDITSPNVTSNIQTNITKPTTHDINNSITETTTDDEMQLSIDERTTQVNKKRSRPKRQHTGLSPTNKGIKLS